MTVIKIDRGELIHLIDLKQVSAIEIDNSMGIDRVTTMIYLNGSGNIQLMSNQDLSEKITSLYLKYISDNLLDIVNIDV